MSCIDWSMVAANWDRHRTFVEAMKAELTPRLVAALELRPGGRVLELGAGTGELAARLADAVAPGGSVVASDAAPGMVELLKVRLDGVAGAEVVQIDADIALPAESVDAIAFRMGLMLVGDPGAAAEQMHRVLRPGGRVAVAVWGAPQDNPWLTTLGMSAMMHGIVQGGPPIGPGTPFSLADPDALRPVLADAGFADVRVEVVDGAATYPDVDAYLDTAGALAPPIAAAMSGASAEQRDALRATVAGALERFRDAAGYHLPTRALLAAGRR